MGPCECQVGNLYHRVPSTACRPSISPRRSACIQEQEVRLLASFFPGWWLGSFGSASGCDCDTTRVQDTIFEKDGVLPIFDKELEFSVSADAKWYQRHFGLCLEHCLPRNGGRDSTADVLAFPTLLNAERYIKPRPALGCKIQFSLFSTAFYLFPILPESNTPRSSLPHHAFLQESLRHCHPDWPSQLRSGCFDPDSNHGRYPGSHQHG